MSMEITNNYGNYITGYANAAMVILQQLYPAQVILTVK